MASPSSRTAASCSVGPAGRVQRGIVALVTAAFAISFFPSSPAMAIVAGVFALAMAVMAITGFCPATWVQLRQASEQAENTLGYEDARAVIVFDEETEATTNASTRSAH